jgi:2OG-Fe(II) oxygenase superfamily
LNKADDWFQSNSSRHVIDTIRMLLPKLNPACLTLYINGVLHRSAYRTVPIVAQPMSFSGTRLCSTDDTVHEDDTMTKFDKMIHEAGWPSQLLELTKSMEPLGTYAVSDSIDNMPVLSPILSVQNVGRIGLPLMDCAVEPLKAVASKAPFGKGTDTIVDESVRRAWQIDADQVVFGGGAKWESLLQEIVHKASRKLGLSNKRIKALGVHANLYKLLLYEEGGHFLSHCDTEKEDGMFGTLVIQLPSSYTGGEFHFSHGGETKSFALSEGSEDTFHYIAFYADCKHQLYPITSGKRLSLVFNLVASPSANMGTPTNTINVDTEAKLQSIAEAWKANPIDVDDFGFRLEHQYTPQSFDATLLKGRDGILYQTLVDAKSSSGVALFDVTLVLMERYYTYYPESGNKGKDKICARKILNSKNEDVTDTEYDTEYFHLRQVPGKGKTWEQMKKSSGWVIDAPSYDEYDCICGFDLKYDQNDQNAYVAEDTMFEWEPDENEPAEYMGNGGAEEKYWYFAAALTLSPA